MFRIAPADASADAVERIASRRNMLLQGGDVVVCREKTPRLRPTQDAPIWRYRVYVHPDRHEGRIFTGFEPAATESEQLATRLKARAMYVEDGVPVMLADYRREQH